MKGRSLPPAQQSPFHGIREIPGPYPVDAVVLIFKPYPIVTSLHADVMQLC